MVYQLAYCFFSSENQQLNYWSLTGNSLPLVYQASHSFRTHLKPIWSSLYAKHTHAPGRLDRLPFQVPTYLGLSPLGILRLLISASTPDRLL